ncbi:MAG TPA: hypothetical protein VHH36_00865 [Candidatus Thermoplasmatota archaeon]|nr:hypothetical protein [Candidatus Thermoplasmatota archaeon]
MAVEEGDARGAAASLRIIEGAISHEGTLRARAEGLTWALWGLVLAAVFLMYAAAGPAYGEADVPSWFAALWVPWVAAGAAVTVALWRAAAVSAPLPRPAAGWGVTALWIGAIAVAFGLLSLAPAPRNPESAPVVAVGLAWLLMGAPNLFRATPTGRRVVVGIGLATALAGLALATLLPAPDPHAPDEAQVRFLQDVLRAGVALGFPLAGGLWQALRG